MNQNRPLRLLVINNVFPPDLAAGAAVFGDMCHGLAELGVEVTVRCAYPYYPEWKDKSGRNGLRIWRYQDQSIKIERYGLYIPKNTNSLIQRLLYEASFLLSLMRGLHRGREFDMVMAYCPAVSCLAFSVVNKFVWRKPLWLNVQDLAAEAADASGLVKRRWLGSFLKAIQRWLFNRADIWSTISPVMAERMASMRSRAQPLVLIPNWLNSSLKQSISTARGAKDQTVKTFEERPRLLYAGNIGKKQNLVAILDILQASDIDFEFRIHGSGAQSDTVKQWVAEKNDTRFSFGDFLNEADFADALEYSHFFVISEHEESGASFMPSKLIPGISSGTPILAVCDEAGPLGVEMQTYSLGPRLDWELAKSLPQLLGNLGAEAEKYRQWSKNCLVRAENYRREAIIQKIERSLTDIAAIETEY